MPLRTRREPPARRDARIRKHLPKAKVFSTQAGSMGYNLSYPLPGGIRMARPRVYRHDVRCPECGSNLDAQGRHLQRPQVYHCGDCGRRTIPDAAYQRSSAADQERALAMYQESSSSSAIARIFGVSVQVVSQWVKKGGPPHGPGCVGGAQSALLAWWAAGGGDCF